MCDEASMRPEPLSRHGAAQSFFLLGHISDMITLCIHNNVLIRLLEATRATELSVRWQCAIGDS